LAVIEVGSKPCFTPNLTNSTEFIKPSISTVFLDGFNKIARTYAACAHSDVALRAVYDDIDFLKVRQPPSSCFVVGVTHSVA